MAKQTGVIAFTGKLGQVVGSNGQDGRNYLRVRRYTIKNPKTDAQCAQRMICYTASQAVSQLKEIFNNSFEGKSFGTKSIQHARSLIMRQLRTTPSLVANGFAYLKKGQLVFPLNPYVLSEGSLPAPGVVWDPLRGAYVPGSFTAQTIATITASALFPNVAIGNQITLLGVFYSEGASVVKYCRFAFKDNTTPALVASGGAYALNPNAIDTTLAEGDWAKVQFTLDEEREDGIFISLSQISGIASGANEVGFAIIASDKIAGKRSNATLQLAEYEEGEIERGGTDAAEAMPTYGDSGASLNVPSDYYLQNSVD